MQPRMKIEDKELKKSQTMQENHDLEHLLAKSNIRPTKYFKKFIPRFQFIISFVSYFLSKFFAPLYLIYSNLKLLII